MTRPDHRPFGEGVDAAIMAHAGSERRQEICGIVTADPASADGYGYRRLPNSAADPARHFRIDPARLAGLPPVLAVVHSHPDGPPWPSADDLRQAQQDDVPWGIAVPAGRPHAGLFWFGTGIEAPLETRGYRHGVTDCYALVRDWYRRHAGISLIDRPRAWQWWQEKGDLYSAHFAQSGFVRLPPDAALRTGDVALAAVLGEVINHALVHVGDGLVLHHPAGRSGYEPGRLPRTEPAQRWRKYIRYWARHPKVSHLLEEAGR